MSLDEIPGLKIIYFNTKGIDIPDDPSFPFKLELDLRPPELMTMAFVGLYGGNEKLILRSMTKDALDQFIQKNHLRKHARLRRLIITGPEGVLEEIY